LTADDPDRLHLLWKKLMVFKELDQGSFFAATDWNPDDFIWKFF
jgi:hypothetical protein